MNQLAQQQSALLDALLSWPATDAMKNIAAYAVDPGLRGLKAYQTNGHVAAQRALAAAYPVVAQIVGEEGFGDLARALWHAHPPTAGDLARWGGQLPAFVQTSDQLRDVPYLADLARLEWCLHRCATAADAAPDPASLALLTHCDPAGLTLQLAPGTAAVCSAWPVVSMVAAHTDGMPSLDAVGALLRAGTPQDAVVWRSGWQAQSRCALPGEAAVLQALLRGASLADALQAAADLNFSEWFPAAVQSGLVLGAACPKGEGL